MNTQIVAILISEGSKIISNYIRSRPLKIERVTPPVTYIESVPHYENPPEPPKLKPEKPPDITERAISVEAGCVPCAIGHLGTCSGLLNEAMRFAYKDGFDSDEVISRINMCLDELNGMERIDLRPEKIASLETWEKELANMALTVSRSTRHRLEAISSVDDLEQLAANTQTIRNDIGTRYFKRKMKHITPEEQEEVTHKVIQRLKELREAEDEEDNEPELDLSAFFEEEEKESYENTEPKSVAIISTDTEISHTGDEE